ncbi:MAG: histidine ammonia-lyase [Vicinamibacterales bacterium]
MIVLDGRTLTVDAIAAIAGGAAVALARDARAAVAASRAVVDRAAAGETAVYGVNTGFGSFAQTRIAPGDLERLQINLVRSHAAGAGEPLSVRTVRAAMALRANVLAKGHSGVRVATLEALLACLNRDVHPYVPSRGSVGASGDLAPLAHIALALIGEGDVWDGTARRPAAAALAAAGLTPIVPAAKEGLALVNGTQASTAVLALAVADAARLARAADVVAALTIDALRGSLTPFDARIHAARPYQGQRHSADNLRRLLAGSPLNASHANCGRVQDAYSMRCVPQVHGAARDLVAHAAAVVEIEANAATDNPMVFADDGAVLSGGNFHGAPVALAADALAIAVVQLATISERRSERLVNPALSGLPPFLTRHGGLESGLMLAQVTAAALTSELKALAHPASVDSIPTSANQEDHVSMSMHAALKAERVVALATQVVAVELVCACQAIDLLAPLVSSAPLMQMHARVREVIAPLAGDRPPAPDIAAAHALIGDGAVEYACGVVVN